MMLVLSLVRVLFCELVGLLYLRNELMFLIAD